MIWRHVYRRVESAYLDALVAENGDYYISRYGCISEERFADWDDAETYGMIMYGGDNYAVYSLSNEELD